MTSAVKWSPFAGMKMAGFVRATYVRGRKVFENGQLLADPAAASSSGRIDNEPFGHQFDEDLFPRLPGFLRKSVSIPRRRGSHAGRLRPARNASQEGGCRLCAARRAGNRQ